MKRHYLVIEDTMPSRFEQRLNAAAEEGGKVISSSCGFANSEKYDFCSTYQTIVEFEE